MSDVPERILLMPEGLSAGLAVRVSNDEIEYRRADLVDAEIDRLTAERDRLYDREAALNNEIEQLRADRDAALEIAMVGMPHSRDETDCHPGQGETAMSDNTKFNFDLGLRHTSGITSNEFIRRYCEVFRPYAYATRDDSLNEFEKLITHVLGMLCYHKRRAELLGLPTDPRDSIEAIEGAMAEVKKAKYKLAGALYAARGDLPDYDSAIRKQMQQEQQQ